MKRRLAIRVKHIIDTIAVALTAPLWLLASSIVAAAVAVSMGTPVLYRQLRVGLNETEFEILKFRTMTNTVDDEGNALPDGQRLTAVGRVLRKLSLDELPQLLNVLRGDMAIVGPRPLYPSYLPFYSDRERLRHTVRPGITGLAQVEGRNDLLWNARLELDAQYAESVSLRGDLAIVVKTISGIAGGDGVSVLAGESGEPLHIARSYPVRDGYTMRRFEYPDIPHRLRWMRDQRTRQHMNLPAHATDESTVDWLRRSRKTPGRFDFSITEIQSDVPVAMAGLTPRLSEALPELYVFVDPDLHGRGVGRATMAILLDWMRANEQEGCWLTVASENTAAIALYQGCGFETAVAGPQRLRMECHIARVGASETNP